MKLSINKFLLGGLLAPLSLIYSCYQIQLSSSSLVIFESWESTNKLGKPVVNKIQFKPNQKINGETLDLWLMQQSHDEGKSPHHQWDRLMIAVNTKNGEADFHQFEPGLLSEISQAKPIDFKVSCLMCHNEGPRAIRPLPSSKKYPLSFADKLQIFSWNIKIKSYGKLKAISTSSSKRSLNLPLPILQKKLRSGICILCHHNYWGGRGYLKLQNRSSVKFMLENQQMPPLPIPLSDHQRNLLKDFFHL